MERQIYESEKLRKVLGVSRAEFSRRYNIPIRTLEAWDAGINTPPAYVMELLGRAVKEDMGKEDDEIGKADKGIAKRILAEGGVKVYQKDIKEALVHKFTMKSPDGSLFPHRYIYRVEMKDGKVYEALSETVDKDGNFSLSSARFKTQSVHEL